MKSPFAVTTLGLCVLSIVATARTINAQETITYSYVATGMLHRYGTDYYDLNGASYRAVFDIVSKAGPDKIARGNDVVRVWYRDACKEITISNRPNGKPDLTLSPSGQISVANLFAPSTVPDNFSVAAWDTLAESGRRFHFVYDVHFPDQAFFPGTDIPDLPTFTGADIVQVFTMVKVDDSYTYELLNPSLRATNTRLLLEELISLVGGIDGDHATMSDLDSQLKNALKLVEDGDTSARDEMKAFINAVEAQRTKEISDTDADRLISQADQIVATMQN